MSTFDQKKQNVNSQINVAGDLKLQSQSTSTGVIYITAIESQRYFCQWAENFKEDGKTISLNTRVSFDAPSNNPLGLLSFPSNYTLEYWLSSEPDFNIYIDGKHVGYMSAGEIVKFNVVPGERRISILPNMTPLRSKCFGKTGLKSWFLYSGEKIPPAGNYTVFRFTIDSGEIIDIEYEPNTTGGKFRFKR